MEIGTTHSFVTGDVRLQSLLLVSEFDGQLVSQSERKMHPAHCIIVKKSTETAALSCDITVGLLGNENRLSLLNI